MKQSKKLLSIFLAMLMLLGTVSVVGSAAKEEFSKSTITYDSIDNAALTAEQVADIVLDMVDDMLKDIDLSDINDITSVLGINLDFSSIDKAAETIYGLRDIIKNGKLGIELGGDLNSLNVNAFNGLKRANGDISVVVGVLKFLADNFDGGANIQKAVYGVGEDSKPNQFGVGGILWSGKLKIIGIINVNLGFSVEGILKDPDLLGMGWSVNNILADLQGFVKYLVYDMVMYGSYPYSSDGVNKEYNEVSSQFTDVTLDGMVDIILKNFLTTPQDYEYVPTGEVDAEGNPVSKKVWDESSYILSASKYAALGDLSLANNSLLGFVDKILQIAYEDFGVPFLNNDLKRNFMRAMGADFITLDDTADAKEIANAKADPDYIDVTKASADKVALVKNYFCNAQMWNVDGTWYYRGFKTVETGEVDAEGNMKTVEKDVFQRVDINSVDSLFRLFKWDYNLTADTLDFDAMIKQYGSIIGCLNHLLYVVFDNAINVKALGLNSIADIWKDGGNSNFNENLMSTAKFLLKEFTFMFFGRNEAYVDLNTFKATDEFKKQIDNCKTVESLVAYIGLPLLSDVLPQLVYDPAMFTEGLQIEQTAALLVREFLSDLTPQINYDAEIFEDASLATGRKFKTHTSAEWMDIVLNMGLDLAMTYLDNITNINVTGKGLENLHNIAKSKGVPSWKVVLEEIVDWAVLYIGNGDNAALNGLSPNALGAVRCITDGTNADANNYAGNAFNTLSTALNALLPLGLLCHVSSATHALDVEMVFNRLIDVIDDLDLEVLLGTFGRNGRDDNILTSKNVLAQVLGLVNKLLSSIWGRTLIENTTSLVGFISNENISRLLVNLIDGLYERGDQLLRSLLPTVAQFVPDWGGEQVFRAPEIDIDTTMTFGEGSGSGSFTVSNGSKRVWRSYVDKDGTRKQDEQYKMIIEGVAVYGADYGVSPYMTVSGGTGTYDFGGAATVNYSIANLPKTGALARVEVTYKVTGYDGSTPLTSESLKVNKWIWLNGSNEAGQTWDTDSNGGQDCRVQVWGGDRYFDYSDINSLKNDINGYTVYNISKSEGSWIDSAVTVGIDVSGDQQFGIKAPASNTQKTKDALSVDGKFQVVDEAALATVNETSTPSWTFNGKANSTSVHGDCKNAWVKFHFYNGAALGELRAVVDKELSAFRPAEDYDTSSPACTQYVTALEAAARGARQNFNTNSVFNYTELKTNLEAAIEAIEAVKKTETSIGTAIADLANTVKSVENTLNGKDYRTYALYRWNRFQDVYKDAKGYIELNEKVALGVETMNFEYSGYTANKVSSLLANDSYKEFVEALYVAKTAEEALQAKEEYENRKLDLANCQAIDVANTKQLLPAMVDRLVGREGGVIKTYLEKEIASAEKTFTDLSKYSEMSRTAYEKALSNAKTALSSDSQDTIFDAKYQLQVARNNLRTVEDEADYTEINELIKQAEQALKNPSYYKNYTDSKADFGMILVALGYTTKDGTRLFGGAKDVASKSYSKADQDEVDDAADELKIALAKLEFKDFASKKPSGVEATDVTTGAEDETGNAVTENIYTKKIEAKQVKKAVADALAVAGCTVEVSLDSKYSAMSDSNLETIPVGTGATVTILQKVEGVNVPVATIKLIVEGDVTGDGVIDTLDCMIAELAANEHTELNGVYLIAGDLQANDKVDDGDLSVIVNKAIPDKIA